MSRDYELEIALSFSLRPQSAAVALDLPLDNPEVAP
jgi:hypothetical protein